MNNAQMILRSLAADMSFGERLSYAGRVLLIGMAAVFSVLALIWLVLVLARLVLAREPKETPAASAPAPVPTPAPAAKPAPAETPAPAPAATDDGEIVAAITAAITAYLAAEQGVEAEEYTGGFRVVSFRRVGGAWNRGRK